MGTYRPLRLVFFIYDFIRLVVMTSLLVTFSQTAASSNEGGLFPYVFYAVPNGLFPLMSFFLCVNFRAYKPFIALYMAGKISAVVSVIAWFVFSLPRVALSFSAGSRTTFAVIGTALLLSAGDALSVLGGAVLRKQVPDAALPQEPENSTDPGSVDLGPDEVPEEGN